MKRSTYLLVGMLIAAILSGCASYAGEVTEPLDSSAWPHPGGLSEEEYSRLPKEEQLKLKRGLEDGVAPESDTPGLIPKDMREFSDAINEFSTPIYSLQESYPDVFSTFEVNQQDNSIVVGVAATATPERQRAFTAAASAILAAYSYPYSFPLTASALAPLKKVAEELTADYKTWQPRFGGSTNYTADPDVKAGAVQVTTETQPLPDWTRFELNGVLVIVTSADAPVAGGGSRLNDVSPRYSGIRLNNSAGTGICTSGFHWRSWSTNQVFGSTAYHCSTKGATQTFYNSGRLVGRMVVGSMPADTLLIDRSGGSYSPYVYVGSTHTSELSYVVVSANTRPVGAAIAIHPSFSTPGITTVAFVGRSIFCGDCGSYTVHNTSVTWSLESPGASGPNDRCQIGDSGAPWITSNGSTATAHGQHFGWTRGTSALPGTSSSSRYCTYVDVNHISASLQATLVTG